MQDTTSVEYEYQLSCSVCHSGSRLRDFNVGGLNRMLNMREQLNPDSYPVCFHQPGRAARAQIFNLTCSQILRTRYVIVQVSFLPRPRHSMNSVEGDSDLLFRMVPGLITLFLPWKLLLFQITDPEPLNQNNPDDYDHVVHLCEVQVFASESGRFGFNHALVP